MPKRIRIRRRILEVVVCAAVSWCVAPRATMAAPQCAQELTRPVPPVVGQKVSDAKKTLAKAGFKLVRVKPPNGIGLVAQQNPKPNTCAQPDTTPVEIEVKNPIPVEAANVQVPEPQCLPVPPLKGEAVSAAKAILQKGGLALRTVNPPNGTGVVFRQIPDPNRCVPVGTPVDIWVENPAPAPATSVEVPDLRGKSEAVARLVVAWKGLRYGGSSKEESSEVPPGRIFDQQPAAGTRVPKDTAVVVTLAEAVTVPPPPPETLTLKSNLNGVAIPREVVTFIAGAQGPAHTIQYQFDFGDSTKSASSDSPLARHVYTQDGNYTATVTATLGGGVGQLTASTVVGVHEAIQDVALDVSPRPATEKQLITFTAHVYPPEPAPLRYTFQFGDNSKEVSKSPSVTHTYQRNGVYRPLVSIVTAHQHNASSNPVRLIVVQPPLSVWVIVLVTAGVLASAAFVGVVGYRLLQKWVTRGISSNLRLDGVTLRLQASHAGLEEDEFQFHTDHSPGVIVVQDRASVVRNVEVRK